MLPQSLRSVLLVIGLVVVCHTVVAADDDLSNEGGGTTVDAITSDAYSRVAPNLGDAAEQLRHDVGETGFHRDFSRVKVGGKIRVGPHSNSVSCSSCHVGNGRGEGKFALGLEGSDTVIKVSVPGAPVSRDAPARPVPGIGFQLHDHAVHGVRPDVRITPGWLPLMGAFSDGTQFELRSPHVTLRAVNGRFPSTMSSSARRAPPIFGTGLLDAISDATIQALADPEDRDGDGISGRVNTVWEIASKTLRVGRFGLKAAAPSLRQQVAVAYANDMGVTNPLVKLEDKRPEIAAAILDATTFYTATLGVPRGRNQEDPRVVRGLALFQEARCSACHLPTMITESGLARALSHQTIHPFTDLLLHDMGEGLADNRDEFSASGREWRTAPLWGIGLSDAVIGGEANYLHDGRARTLEEAIVWHGGEAQSAQSAFVTMNAEERDALIAFLRSL